MATKTASGTGIREPGTMTRQELAEVVAGVRAALLGGPGSSGDGLDGVAAVLEGYGLIRERLRVCALCGRETGSGASGAGYCGPCRDRFVGNDDPFFGHDPAEAFGLRIGPGFALRRTRRGSARRE